MNLRRKNISFKSDTEKLLEYLSRDEAVDNSKINSEEMDNMLSYYTRPTASDTVGFDFSGDVNKDALQKEFNKYSPKEIYTGVISLKKNDADILDIKNKRDWSNLASKFMKKACTEMNIPEKDLIWAGFYHTNTDNPHIHFYAFSKTKKNLNLLSKKKIKRCRSILANIFLDNVQLFQDKELFQTQQLNQIKDYMEEVDLDHLLKQNIVFRMMSFNVSFEDKLLANEIVSISNDLDTKGRMTMKYFEQANPDVYERVMNISDEILQKNPKMFSDFEGVCKSIEGQYKIIYGNSKYNEYSDNQIKRLKEKVGNLILKEIKNSGIIKDREAKKGLSNFDKNYYNNYFSYSLKQKLFRNTDMILGITIQNLFKEIKSPSQTQLSMEEENERRK